MLRGVDADIVVAEHTHRQKVRVVGEHRFVNAGAVGMPYNGRAGAFWLSIGTGVQLRRTDYDLDRAVATMREGGYPNAEEEMLRESLREPAGPDRVASIFERQALERHVG